MEERKRRRSHSRAYYRRRRKRRERIRLILISVALGLTIVIMIFLVRAGISAFRKPLADGEDKAVEDISLTEGQTSGQDSLEEEEETVSEDEALEKSVSEDETPSDNAADYGIEEDPEEKAAVDSFSPLFDIHSTGSTVGVTNPEVNSQYCVLMDPVTNEIIAERNADTVISPASMTKILTLLVASEHVSDWNETVTMDIETTDFVFSHECSAVGFSVGETVPVKDLFYGTILPSGGDAALALAKYVAGSEEAFVQLMNEKVAALGLSSTARFAGCIGIYDENTHCTVKDMAMILKAALQDTKCRAVLREHIYTTSKTEQHPEGIEISNWFLRRIEDKDTHGEVMGAKTGFVVQSGNCAASFSISNDGKPYICVTGQAHSAWRCIYDHVAIYADFL